MCVSHFAISLSESIRKSAKFLQNRVVQFVTIPAANCEESGIFLLILDHSENIELIQMLLIQTDFSNRMAALDAFTREYFIPLCCCELLAASRSAKKVVQSGPMTRSSNCRTCAKVMANALSSKPDTGHWAVKSSHCITSFQLGKSIDEYLEYWLTRENCSKAPMLTALCSGERSIEWRRSARNLQV